MPLLCMYGVKSKITHFNLPSHSVTQDCNADWVFSAGEQQFYAEKNLLNEPTRCKECRRVLKDARRRRSRKGGRGRSKVCYAFQTGSCTRGEECKFEHSLKEEAGDGEAAA